jgi:3D (Asp-Asp-Asp) domain-containing protein
MKSKIKNSLKRNYPVIFMILFVITVPQVYSILQAKTIDDLYASRKMIKALPSLAIEVKTEPSDSVYEYYAKVTAYNAGVEAQTDDSPCIAASGENICTAIALGYKRCAANGLPFGTKLEVEGYGICTVTDRMNKRYFNGQVDVAFAAGRIEAAENFGAKHRLVKILNLSQ